MVDFGGDGSGCIRLVRQILEGYLLQLYRAFCDFEVW